MKTTGGFKLWQIIYPIGIYYVVSSLMYFVLGLFLGDGQQTYMLRQLICSAATIPATMSFYKQDKIAEQVVYGTEKEKLDIKWLTDVVLAVVGAVTLGIAVNNIIAMTPLVQMSEGFQEANLVAVLRTETGWLDFSFYPTVKGILFTVVMAAAGIVVVSLFYRRK